MSEQQFKEAKHYSDVLPSAVSTNCIQSDRECFAQEAHHVSMEWLPFVDGKDHLLEITKVKLSDHEGNVIGLIGLAADITERKKLESGLMESRHLLRQLAEQTEILREEERKRIAREVHDELGSILTALRMDVALVNLLFGEQNAALFKKTQGMTVLLDQAGQCVHDIVSNLRPMALDIGIVPAVKWLCDEFSARTGSPCILHLTDENVNLDEARAVAVFRMVQELLTNVARHAGTSSVQITLESRADSICIQVRDDGKGFNSSVKPKNKSFGLLGIRERAIALGGEVEVVSAPSRGTVVTIIVPTKLNRGHK